MSQLARKDQAIKGSSCACGKSQTQFSIAGVPHLYLIVSSKDGPKKRKWQLRHKQRVGGKQITKTATLGYYPALTLADAAKQRGIIMGKIIERRADVAMGIEPDDSASNAPSAPLPTFGELASEAWRHPHPKTGHTRSQTTIDNHQANLNAHVFDRTSLKTKQPLRDTPCDLVVFDDIAAAAELKSGQGKKTTARMIIEACSVVFAYGQQKYKIESNPAQNQARFESKKKPKKPPIEPDQLKTIWQATFDKRFRLAPGTRLLIRIALLLGVRRKLIAGAERSELRDLENDLARWVMPVGEEVDTDEGKRSQSRTKNTEYQIIPLTRQVADLFIEARELSKDAKYVFPGRKPGTHIDLRSVSKAMRNIVNKVRHELANGANEFADIEKCTLHTMRHTITTTLENAGTPSKIVDLVLHHLDKSTRATIYSSAQHQDELRHAYTLWQTTLMRMVEGEPPGDDLTWQKIIAHKIADDDLLQLIANNPALLAKVKAIESAS